MKSSEEKLGPGRVEVFEVEREEGCPPHALLNAARFLWTGRVEKSCGRAVKWRVFPEQRISSMSLIAEGVIALVSVIG